MKHLFAPLTLRGHTIKNRIFSTGHMTVMLEDNLPTPRMAAYHAARAKGGAGLIIIEAARAHRSGMSGRPAIRAYDDACIPGYARIVESCHQHGAKVFAQLTHPGREMTTAADGTQAVALAPSAVPNERFHVMPRAMTQQDIAGIVTSYTDAAAHLRKAGLDGVEIVASHGVLAAQFLNLRSAHSFATRQLIGTPQCAQRSADFVQVLYENSAISAANGPQLRVSFRKALRNSL